MLQEKSFERVGGVETIQTDVRIIAATHKDLEQMIMEGNFRQDLYYRINVFLLKCHHCEAAGRCAGTPQ